MNEFLKNPYRLLTFDNVDSNDTMFNKNSKISYENGTLIYLNGGLPIGIAFVTIDDIGLLCDIYFYAKSNMEKDNEELKRRLDRDEQYIEKVVTQLDLLVNIVGTMLKRW